MPRGAREKSSTGIYHVVMRGINKQIIFNDDEDRQFYLAKVKEYKKTCGYEIYAYCLMNNHIHLLMKEGINSLGISFRRIGASYVYWYNWKYDRVGHLFQDRYKSEAVEDDKYFLTVLRYIHQNPFKAGLINDLNYPWSSYREYIQKPIICNIELALNMFSKEQTEAKRLWADFNQAINDDLCLDINEKRRLGNREAVEIIKTIAAVKDPKEVGLFEGKHLTSVIQKFKKEGLSIRQIETLTGISFWKIRKV
ncbi:MAG: transposase [Bacillota bacterium]|nr:transposase [Bacillota bacterium]